MHKEAEGEVPRSAGDATEGDTAGGSTAPMDEQTLEFATALFAALANPVRLRIVEVLTERERTVNGVTQALGLLQPNASQHLAILSRAGVVKATREGTAQCYALRGPRIARILRLVDEFRAIHANALRTETAAQE